MLLEALGAARPNPGSSELSEYLTVLGEAQTLEKEEILHRDDLAFHADDLRHAHHFARAVGEP